MPVEIWPEFVYGNLSLDQYIRLVRDEERDVKEEIVGLARLLRDIARYPYETSDQALAVTGRMCDAIGLLLELL